MDDAGKLAELDHGTLCRAVFDYAQERILEVASQPQKAEKQVGYVSMEILPGRTLANNLMNLPESKALKEILDDFGIDINEIENMEMEPKLGNGGLGRLAGCIIESASTKNVPLTVHTLRFRNGLFRQNVDSGRQIELKDCWFDENDGYPFEIQHPERTQKIQFFDYGRPVIIKAIPYDIPVIGASTAGNIPRVNYIRMWAVDKTEAYGEHYVRIDDQLYPSDSTIEGKKLRLRQEYFLSAAAVGDMICTMKENHWDIASLPDHVVLHINDTHPTLMIPELMRILRHEYHMDVSKALEICKKVFVYTNHTILAEALECWDIALLEEMLPHVYAEILCLHRCFEAELHHCYNGDWQKMQRMDILWDGKARMANMAIYGSYRVNGVAKIHTDILCRRELKDFYEFFPEKFCNITNGVTQRKWLVHANPELTSLIDGILGSSLWQIDLEEISSLTAILNQDEVLKQFARAHEAQKEKLRRFILKKNKVDLPVHFIYDVQVKRMHEYKRQLLNCMKIIALYHRIKNDSSFRIYPTAFIFAGKAAEDYREAKLVIELILALEKLIKSDSKVNQMLRVVFIEDYDVSKGEMIFAAADVSEQISTASKEASGTGNMKFMMNGAVTLGTLDGANVEIFDAVGDENMYCFGLSMDEVMHFEANPGLHKVMDGLKASDELKDVVQVLRDGTISRTCADNGDSTFSELANELIDGKDGNMPDRYFLLKDFHSYMKAFEKLNADYMDADKWNIKRVKNIIASARFSSDRTVSEYAKKVWKIS